MGGFRSKTINNIRKKLNNGKSKDKGFRAKDRVANSSSNNNLNNKNIDPGVNWRTKKGKRIGLSGFLKRAGKVFKHDTKLGHYLHKHKGTAALGAVGAALLAKKIYNDNKLMNQYKDAIMNNRGLRRKVMGI